MRTGAWIAVFAACVAAAGAACLALGQDVNWDLRNYHYYNAFALLEGRRWWDVVPAQLQTFHNPLPDLPFYALVQTFDSPRLIAVAMALPAAIAVFFLAATAWQLFAAHAPSDRALLAGAAVAIGCTGSSAIAVLGSTMNEWHSAAFLMPAVYLVARAAGLGDEPRWTTLVAAGALAGFATGLKLTYALFAVGLLAASASWGAPRAIARRSLLVAAGMAAGFLAAYGPWGWILWRDYGNPFFPYFNGLFHSPWWEPRSFFDDRYGPRNLLEALAFPWVLARRNTLVSEVGFRDYRLAVATTAGVLVLLRWALARARPRARLPAPWRALVAFALVSYLLWLALYSIYRYLVPLELLAGPLIVGALAFLVRPPGARRTAVVLTALTVMATTVPPGWGRIPFGERYFQVEAPELPPDSLVVLTHDDPMAYAIAFFRRDARFVAPSTNVFSIGQENRMVKRAERLIRDHRGPLFALQFRGPERERTRRVLEHFELVQDRASCRVVRSNLDNDAMQVCALERR